MRRYLKLLFLGGCGLSVVVIGIYVSYYWKNRRNEADNKGLKRKASSRKRISLSEHLLSWVRYGDIIRKPSKRDILLSQGDSVDKAEVDAVEKQSKDSPPSSVSSYTSFEEIPTSCTDSSTSSASSGDSEDRNVIDGAVGVSTYEHFDEKSLTDSEFQELLHSPIVTPNSGSEHDERTKPSVKGRSLSSEFAVVQEYDSELSPSIVDSTYSNIHGQYCAIVMPLCPNTGRIVPDEYVTRRKRKSDLEPQN